MRPTLRDLRPQEYWRRFATEKRILSSIEVRIDHPDVVPFVVWPFDPKAKPPAAKLTDLKENWLTARVGSSVLLQLQGTWGVWQISGVRLHDVLPEKYRSMEVTSAIDWLEGVPGLHKSQLQQFGEGIPCDLRGYIPTEQTGPFDLDWPYRKPTHRYNGEKTPYGLLWENDWPALKAEAIRLTSIAIQRMAAQQVG